MSSVVLRHVSRQRLHVLALLCCLLAPLPATADAATLRQALDTPLIRPDGSTTRIAERHTGKPIYLKFWASWCGTCLAELPHLRQAWREHGADVDFYYVNLGINDSAQDVADFIDAQDLDVPVLIDNSGRLASAFGVRGTPWNVLLDETHTLRMNGSAAPSEVDPLLALLANPAAAAARSPRDIGLPGPPTDEALAALTTEEESPALFFFLATWCDWYLEERRPETAARCIRAQNMVNAVSARFPGLPVKGIASRLWTGAEEVDAYRDRRSPVHAIRIDEGNRHFLAYEVAEIPTLLLIDGNEVLHRETQFSDAEDLYRSLSQHLERQAP
jgi:thiol-disulfide isomerase/thioredoxin